MTEKPLKENTCQCCFMIFESEEELSYCDYCDKNFAFLAISSITRIDRILDVMPDDSLQSMPETLKLIWQELKPLLKANK